VEEVGDVHPQRVRHVQEMAELHLVPGFHALDRRPVEAGCVGEGFLGEVEVQPSYSDAVADVSSGVEDPLGLIGWHAVNRIRIMIISQQQICGINRS
jgi:hypothetical protein